MDRSDENSSLRNWILARNFLKNLFLPLFLRVDCCQLQDASIKPLCQVCSQKLKFLWPIVSFIEVSEYSTPFGLGLHTSGIEPECMKLILGLVFQIGGLGV